MRINITNTFTAALLFASLFISNSMADTIKVVYEPWMPYLGVPSSDMPGFTIEIAKKALPQHKLTFIERPFTRSLSSIYQGKSDFAIAMFEEDLDTSKVIIPAEEVGMSITAFFVKNDSQWQYKDMDSLKQIKLGIVQDYSYPDLDAYIQQHKDDKNKIYYLVGIDTPKRGLMMLQKGRIGATFEDKQVTLYAAKRANLLDKIKIAGIPGPPARLIAAFSAKNPNAKKYAKQYDEGVRALRRSGRLQKILEKYGAKDWK